MDSQGFFDWKQEETGLERRMLPRRHGLRLGGGGGVLQAAWQREA